MRPLDKVLIAGFISLVLIKNTSPTSSPSPGPGPDMGKGMRVVWVVESHDKTPQYITNQTDATEVRTYLNTHCALDGKQPAYRVYDPHTDLKNVPDIWKQIMDTPRKSVPWLYVTKGRSISSGVPPKDIPSLMTLLKKYGGA